MASSSSSLRKWTYRVFASFHGPDVRKTFLSHLRKQLNGDGITMFNDQEIVRGETIGPALTQAISESRISIVVLSKKYASSSWCLDELLEILKCKENIGQIVMTVFYEVDPSDVRNQTGEFGIAFNETCEGKTMEETQKWSQALNDVGNIAGEHFLKWDNESKMIEKIARDVSTKLDATISWDFKDIVGIEAHLRKMKSLLQLDKEDEAMIVGICGPAGIGKTTIARALHSRLSCSFHLTCFMDNLRGRSNSGRDEYGSKLCLQKQLLSMILNQNGMNISNLGSIRGRLYDQKVLIVLDDVDDLKQLEALANETKWFGPGSRIIVTTEDQELLEKRDINNTYHVDFPTEEEARKIFRRYAFRKSSRPAGFEKLIERVTNLCSRLPLGLRVMGSYLCKKTKEDWEDILQGLENSLDPVERDIERVLKVGYESLREKDQLLFLLIAFFSNYKAAGHVKDMLAENNFNIRLGLKTLANKSLIQISAEGNIVMHKLLQQVGRQVVQRQDRGKRQILIDCDDICYVHDNEHDYRSVIGISLDMSTIPNGMYINARAFKKIPNLRFINIYKTRLDTNVRVNVPEDMDFPPHLRLLHWEVYPRKCLPSTFRPEYLVELNLQNNKLVKLWEGTQLLSNLKKIDLSESLDLKELPNLSNATNLEKLNLKGCKSLVEIPSSIGNGHKLEWLNLNYCHKLPVVPTLFNLASLYLSACWQLRKLPDTSTNITDLTIADTMLEKMCDSIRSWSRLKNLNILGNVDSRQQFADIEKIPDCIKDLHELESLYICFCPRLASLPELPGSLETLTVESCESLETVYFPSDAIFDDLSFPDCFNLDGETQELIMEHSLVAFFPGSEIPAEYEHQAMGNSLTIRSDFKEFRVCAVVSPNQQMDDCSLLCHIRINGCPIMEKIDHLIYTVIDEHLLFFYSNLPEEEVGWLEQDNEILFKFSTSSHELNIIQCGVQILTNETNRSISSYGSGSEQLSEDDTTRNGHGSYESGSEQLSEDDDANLSDGRTEFDEPRAKRLKT